MAKAPHGNNQPPPVIIVKKIIAEGHGGHHGGAWKVAYDLAVADGGDGMADRLAQLRRHIG